MSNHDDTHSRTLTRRGFLGIGAGAVGVALADAAGLQASRPTDKNCILLFLVGGPSQLDTWDLKPDAPEHIRGPFRPIQTNVPGTQICEHFPRMARLADQYAIVRSVHHKAAAIHETGQQLMQTGHLAQGGLEHPHYGAVLSHLRGPSHNGWPAYALLPNPIANTGVNISHGQGAGYIGKRHEPFIAGLSLITRESSDLRDRYGRTAFGQSCLLARQLIEHGVRFVTVNMFATVFNRVTWDCHADGAALASNLNDYQDTLCPMFDLAYTALLDDLRQRGLLDTTLVVAMGEFGRTPQVNGRGGRDHHPGVWSILFAGGGIRGGQVIGSSDRHAYEPRDRPVSPAEVAATVYRALGVDSATRLPGPEGRSLPLTHGQPVDELFG